MVNKKMLALFVLIAVAAAQHAGSNTNQRTNSVRSPKTFSLFSVVQFPNDVCTGQAGPYLKGTCLTSSECTTKGGTADGNCAAGFGVCCVIASSTCGSVVSTNTTYVRNEDYPSSTTPTTATTCVFTVNKVNDNICQLRLDFETMFGFVTATNPGVCSDKVTAEGQSGRNPPEICLTNTGYHMYTEFGGQSTDTATVTITYADTATAKQFNILLSQIECTASWKAPTDCVQYFTGTTGTVNSYGFGSGYLLATQNYKNCIRTETGMCGIRWAETPAGTYDSFNMAIPTVTTAQAVGCTTIATGDPTAAASAAPAGAVLIPGQSRDGISPLPIADLALSTAFYDIQCGNAFGYDLNPLPAAMISRVQPFRLGVQVEDILSDSTQTGFSLDYSQVPCV